ncbi:MAG: HNH endonuclease [Hymenobacter sp.]|nr:MAG: HNH endonuclease [Hymenobacter sp.]
MNTTRNCNTTRAGDAWPEDTRKAVWQKGTVTELLDPDLFRYDSCGYLISYVFFGDREVALGWEIDHIRASINGGGDEVSNLQPLNWKNNAAKGDRLEWICGQ